MDGDSLRADSTRLAFDLALSSTSSTLRRLSVRRAWFVGGTLTIPKHSLEQVHLELPTDASLAESAASSGARCVSFAQRAGRRRARQSRLVGGGSTHLEQNALVDRRRGNSQERTRCA